MIEPDDQEASTTSSRLRHGSLLLLGLAVAYSPSYINVALGLAGVEWEFTKGPPSVLLWNWLAVAVLLVFILKVEGRGLGSIALRRPSGRDIQWAVMFWAVSTVASGMLHQFLPPPPSTGMATVLQLSLLTILALVFTTAVTEEVLFRGYSIERLSELTGYRPLAVAVSFGLFVLPHVAFFGVQWLLYHGLGVVLLYVLYVWRRNLWACMIMHLLGNALLLIPALGLAD
ncbi:MAG TPA: type II CAAX endopeptidase family protein [Gammaproteobacteria bacterium]|nr:type II CAAX endopeptidase family protein [Gammaproteobacteria bacterium]HRP86545.1 type II CAAX endopeptidase family protein [Gammaproteobacteria bacterium]